MPRIIHLNTVQHGDLKIPEILATRNLKHLGLFVPAAKRDVSGKKIHQDFFLPYADYSKLAVRIYFEDVLDNNHIVKINKRLVYYSDFDRGNGIDAENNEFIWFEIVKPELVKDEFNLKLSRYKAAYSKLKYEADNNTNPQVRMIYDTLLTFFLAEVQEWLLGNPQPFLDKLNASNLPASIETLLQLNALAGTNKTVRDGIIERVSGVKWQASI